MSIKVTGSAADVRTIENLLQKLCPNVRVNVTTKRVELIDPMGDMTSSSCCCLKFLIDIHYVVTIYPLEGPESEIPGSKKKIGDGGGGATDTDIGATYRNEPGPSGTVLAGIGADTDIYIDISDNDGKGYYVFDARGRPISFPPFIRLGNLLCTGSAYHNARGTSARTPAVRAAQAIKHENDIRQNTNAPNGRPYAQRADDRAGRVGTEGVSTVPDNFGGG